MHVKSVIVLQLTMLLVENFQIGEWYTFMWLFCIFQGRIWHTFRYRIITVIIQILIDMKLFKD